MGAYPPSAEGQKLAVATDHAEATRAALKTLEAGGNAVDGAITAALVLGVVNPVASGIGGGGFALVYVAREKKVVAVDFRETAPAKVDVGALAARDWTHEDVSKRGASVGVPGEPAGLEWLSRRYARRSLADDAAQAVALADRGFSVGRNLASAAGFMRERIASSPELMSAFLPGGLPIAVGAVIRRSDLARTLTRFGAEGAAPFYTGDFAPKIVQAAQAAGAQIDLADLAGYQVKERAPLSRIIDGRAIFTMPAPSAGGLMLLETLSMYGANATSPLKAMGFGSSSYFHTLAEVMRGAVADRARFAGDPDFEPAVSSAYDNALSATQLEARRARIDPNKTHLAPEFRTHEEGTSHVVVADAEGNVVSLTTTVNGPFGARIVAGATGIVLNDELDDFTRPADLAGFGVVGLGPNRPRSHARPVSSMAPTIVIEGGLPILALGGSGGTAIATNVTQAAVARLVFGLDPSACVSAPRIFVNTSSELTVEAEIVDDVRRDLALRGEKLKDARVFGPHPAVQLVAWERGPKGTRVIAAADPRKGGTAEAE
jgi:gamma-glutamyltranspeptidase/glutathione hydrolase